MPRYINHLMAVLCFIGMTGPSLADDVTDQIDEAVKAYEKEDFNTAITALDAASTLIRQKKAESVTKLLPDPLEGWQAEDASSNVAGAGMFGGGISANRHYTSDKRDIVISITSDSPMLQAMSMMFSNPMFMGQENKLVVIDGRKAIINSADNTLTAMVANKVLVKIDGSGESGPDDLKEWFKVIDFKAIEAYAQ